MSATQLLIAIVEPDPLCRKLLNFLLLDEGYDTICAESLEAAYPQLQMQQPDAVILDVQLDAINESLLLLAQLQYDPTTQQIPVIVCSADPWFLWTPTQRRQLEQYPILEKPFVFDELLLKLVELIGPAPLLERELHG